MEIKILNKLVRDKIPLKGVDYSFKYKILDKDEDYFFELKRKLVEEANEVLDSNTEENFLEEMGDVLAVMRALCKAKNISLEDVYESESKKTQERGVFDKRVYVEYKQSKEV